MKIEWNRTTASVMPPSWSQTLMTMVGMGQGSEEKVVWVDYHHGDWDTRKENLPSSLQGRGWLREGSPEKDASFWKRKLLQTLAEKLRLC